MENKLPSKDYLNFLIFLLLSVPVFFSGVGTLLTIFILYSLYMTDKTLDFSHVDKAYEYSKIYIILSYVILTIFFSVVLIWGFIGWNGVLNALGEFSLIAISWYGVFILYRIVLQKFFYEPLERNKLWIQTYGFKNLIYKTNEQPKGFANTGEIFSAADELVKWQKLRDEGIVSEEEFLNVKERLINKESNS